MRRIAVLGVLLVLFISPSVALMGGVLQFTQNGSPVQAPIHQVALGSSGTILWAVAPGGVVYQINATTMQLINSTTLTAAVCNGGGEFAEFLVSPTCLFVDDTHNRVYACYAPQAGGNCMSLFVLNEATMAVLSQAAYIPYSATCDNYYTESGDPANAYQLPNTVHTYDSASRMLASVSWSPNFAQIGIQLYNVSSDSVTTDAIPVSAQNDEFSFNTLAGIQYEASTDAIYLYWDYSYALGIHRGHINYVSTLPGVSTRFAPPSEQPFNQNYVEPFQLSSILPAGFYTPGAPVYTSSYVYVVYTSLSAPSLGSYVLQFQNPPVASNVQGSLTPKSAVPFPSVPNFLSLAIDETAVSATEGVLFISTTSGQIYKYLHTDPGGSASMTVLTPNYNSDTLVSSSYPTLSYQSYSKTARAIYLSSAVQPGGLWMVPFYSCSAATTCAACAGLDDPYCGWCPLSGTCTTNSSCATGKFSVPFPFLPPNTHTHTHTQDSPHQPTLLVCEPFAPTKKTIKLEGGSGFSAPKS
jgi:hypothetical protein